jgi:hypothetical protein
MSDPLHQFLHETRDTREYRRAVAVHTNLIPNLQEPLTPTADAVSPSPDGRGARGEGNVATLTSDWYQCRCIQ